VQCNYYNQHVYCILYLVVLFLIPGHSSSESYIIVINDITDVKYYLYANSVNKKVLMFYL